MRLEMAKSTTKPRQRSERPAGAGQSAALEGERFLASTPWSADRPEHLVVCCSDGRWHEQVEEFMRKQVSSRADLYAAPGGPAAFNLWSSSLEERSVAEKALKFLVEHHQLRAVWLMAHAECAYYRAKFQPLDANYILRRQLQDLQQTAQSIRERYPQVEAHRIYVHREKAQVVFTRLGDNAPLMATAADGVIELSAADVIG
jgi:hypothetical protein